MALFFRSIVDSVAEVLNQEAFGKCCKCDGFDNYYVGDDPDEFFCYCLYGAKKEFNVFVNQVRVAWKYPPLQ